MTTESGAPADWRQRVERLEAENRKMSLLMETAQILSSEKNLDLLLGLIVERTTEIMNADRSSVFLLDRKAGELYSFVAQGLDSTEIRFPATAGLAGHVARTSETLNIPDAYDDARFNREVDRRTGYRTQSVLCMPMRDHRGETLGVIQALNKKDAGGRIVAFTAEDESFLRALGSLAAIFIENARLYQEMDAVFEAFVATAARCIDDRDPCTSGHSRRVAQYAMNLARLVHEAGSGPFAKVRYTRGRMRQIRYAGMLHDFGKIGVREYILCKENKLNAAQVDFLRERLLRRRETGLRELYERAACERTGDAAAFVAREGAGLVKEINDAVALITALNKPGRVTDEQIAAIESLHAKGLVTDFEFENLSVRKGNLTPVEWDDMRGHVAKSYEILRRMPWPRELEELPEIASVHHEKEDGSGYPRGLKDGDIHLDGRILAVVDIYDALTATDRPYKPAIPHEKAKAIIEDEVRLGKLDAELVRLFFEKEAYKLSEGAAGTHGTTTILRRQEASFDGHKISARRPIV